MGRIYSRGIEAELRSAVAESRVVALLGARQVGKSTLAQVLGQPYYTLDDFATRAFALQDPTAFVASLAYGAVIDEVQRVPDLLSAIKAIVDIDQRPGRFVLTGSANIHTLPRIAESLAGRMRVLEVYPLAEAEIERRAGNIIDELFAREFILPSVSKTNDDLLARVVRGGYPEAVRSVSDASRERWFEDYLSAMMQREVREISRIGDIAEIERLLRIVMVRSGQLLSPTALASSMGASKETIRRYFKVLEQLYLIHVLPAWASEAGRIYIKTGKFFTNDTGLAVYQHGTNAVHLAEHRDLLGGLLETFAVNEIRKQASWSAARPRMYHLRTTAGKEADIVLRRRDGTAVAVEVKATASPGASDTKTLRHLLAQPQTPFIRGILLYSGEKPMQVAKNIFALPFAWLWS